PSAPPTARAPCPTRPGRPARQGSPASQTSQSSCLLPLPRRGRRRRRRRRVCDGHAFGLLCAFSLLAVPFLALLPLLLLLLLPLLLFTLSALSLDPLLLQAFLLLVVGGLQLLERGVRGRRPLLDVLRVLTPRLEGRLDQLAGEHGVAEPGQRGHVQLLDEDIKLLDRAGCTGKRVRRVTLDRCRHFVHCRAESLQLPGQRASGLRCEETKALF